MQCSHYLQKLGTLHAKYHVSPFIHVAPSKPPHEPTTREEAIAHEYGCIIEEEDPITEDDEGTP